MVGKTGRSASVMISSVKKKKHHTVHSSLYTTTDSNIIPSHIMCKNGHHHELTVVCVSREVLCINQEVVVRIKLPELAVDDVEMLIREVVCNLKKKTTFSTI